MAVQSTARTRKNTIKNNIVIDNLWVGILLTRMSNRNKILYNNFLSSMPIFYINAFFRNSYLNRWRGNYWDDWIGLKIKLLKWKPKRIPGRMFDFFPNLAPSIFEDIYHSKLTIRANFDLFPANEPYAI